MDLRAEYGWFHVMKPQLVKGLIKEIGETSWAVYTIIKAHVDHTTGRAYPSQERIGEMIGKTPETVSKCIKTLEEFNLITREKVGRHTEYTVLESALVRDLDTGAPQGSLDFNYVPKDFGTQLQAIKDFIQSGTPPGTNLTLNLNINFIKQGDNGVINIQNVELGPHMTTDAERKGLLELMHKLRGL